MPRKHISNHVIVRGLVQGVGFRNFIFKNAQNLSVAGWVRNLPDGSVEILVQGPESDVSTLIAFARQGPPRARVESLEIAENSSQIEENSFTIKES